MCRFWGGSTYKIDPKVSGKPTNRQTEPVRRLYSDRRVAAPFLLFRKASAHTTTFHPRIDAGDVCGSWGLRNLPTCSSIVYRIRLVLITRSSYAVYHPRPLAVAPPLSYLCGSWPDVLNRMAKTFSPRLEWGPSHRTVKSKGPSSTVCGRVEPFQ